MTAYVGARLADICSPTAQQLAREGWQRLSRRRWWLPGWAYNYHVPLDADSTIWAVRLAESVGAAARRIRRAYGFIASHTGPNGGIATYSPKYRIHRHIGLPSRRACKGWYAPHICVSAAAANLDGFNGNTDLRSFLLKGQSEDGAWRGYWWSDAEHPTALALEALHRVPDRPGVPAAIHAARRWLAARLEDGPVVTDQAPHGSPFATACAVLGLSLFKNPPGVQTLLTSSVSWLIENQAGDGSWTSSARLRLPPPDLLDPENLADWRITDTVDAGTIKLDHNRIYTTATAAAAIARFKQAVIDA